MTKSNPAAGDERPDTPPTHIIYMPVWEPDSGKFSKWLAMGTAWRDEHDHMFCELDAIPLPSDEPGGWCFRYLPVGAPPPQPLTVTREEFLEQEVTAWPPPVTAADRRQTINQ
jgi:hypothetical protein